MLLKSYLISPDWIQRQIPDVNKQNGASLHWLIFIKFYGLIMFNILCNQFGEKKI